MDKVMVVNPARAGMIRRGRCDMSQPMRKPRASGDDPPRVRSRRYYDW